MKLEFTKKEVEFFKENCYFSDIEENVLELRLRNESITKIALTLHISESTVNRTIKKIKKKIMKVL